MTTRLHRSSAFVKSSQVRYHWRKPEPITPQFRFVLRMAYACDQQHVPYELEWVVRDGMAQATITVTGDIPIPKALPKAPRLKLVSDWKPTIWDAEYRLDAYYDSTRSRKCPGFVIEHSCGLSLVHPSESGELGVTEHGGDEDIRQKWFVTHTASGREFGLTLNFKRATDALLLAASFAVDWTEDAESLKPNPEFRRAGNTVIAYGTSFDRDTARRKLVELERAA